MKAKPKKRKRLVRGKDWHAWIFKDDVMGYDLRSLVTDKNAKYWEPRWVRVKFVEVPKP